MNFKVGILMSAFLIFCSCDQKKQKVEVEEVKDVTEVRMDQSQEISAKHILVDTEKEAQDLYEKITKGEMSFEDAAQQHSKCPSGSNGGSLGSFGKGVMVKEFEDAAFALKVGEISKPVRTEFGWHLIKVEENH